MSIICVFRIKHNMQFPYIVCFDRVMRMALRIRDLREDNDHKQKDIAKLLNISQATYSRYETGDLEIPHSALQILADFYETSVDYLLGRTDIQTPYPNK